MYLLVSSALRYCALRFITFRFVLLSMLLLQQLTAVAQVERKKNASDPEPWRPAFHFTPPAKWMNDPNGLVYYKDTYHLFYQYYPDSTVWGPMHWGHATSKDLLRWKHQPIALYPDSLGWIFSGSAVIDKDNTAGFGENAMIAIFTYHNDAIWKSGKKNTESQGIAYSLDGGKTWTKYKGNPVLNNSGEQDFRDPKVSWYEPRKEWIMTLAVGDRIKLFASKNLKEWKERFVFKPENDSKDLGVWECPDLFPMKTFPYQEAKWVLIVNHGDKAPNGGSGTRYFIGDFDGDRFVATQPAKWLDHGTDFYAAVTYSNTPDPTPIVQAWMSNWQYAQQVPTTNWRSAMTLPRKLKLIKNQQEYFLMQTAITSFQECNNKTILFRNTTLPFVTEGDFVSGGEFAFHTEIMPYEKSQELTITLSNKKGEKFTIRYKDGIVSTDRSQSGVIDFSEKFANKPQTLWLEGDVLGAVHLFLDKASVEILINNGRFSMTNIYFPTEPYSKIAIESNKPQTIYKVGARELCSKYKQ